MTNVNKGTKKYEQLMWSHRRYQGDSVNNVYGTCSQAKKNVERYIKEMMLREGGYNYHITGHNCNFFSCSFETDTHVYYFTHANDYILEK